MRVPTVRALLVLCSSATAAAALIDPTLEELKDNVAGQARAKPEVIPGAYMIRLRDGKSLGVRSDEHTHDAFARRALKASIDYEVRFEFKEPDLFYGLSVKVPNNDSLAELEAMPEVSAIWPVPIVPRPLAPMDPIPAKALEGLTKNKKARRNDGPAVARRQTATPAPGTDFNTPHSMTGVDRLHPRGIKGKGIKIAIIDSGVDYTHPALGGCFGPGCKVSFGYDFVGDEFTGYNDPIPDDDPYVGCPDGGHGTHVAGIIGMQVAQDAAEFPGLTGVAPEAELGMYRVFGCSGGVGLDLLAQSIITAAEGNPDIITMSVGSASYFAKSPYDPFTQLISGVTERGILVIAAAGNDGAFAPFSINAPSNTPTALSVGAVENTLFQVFELQDSKGNVIKYGSTYPFPQGKELKVLVLSQEDMVTAFGCRPANYDSFADIQNKDDFVILAKRGLCSLSQVQATAAATGFRNVLTYPDLVLLENPFLRGYAANIPALDEDGELLNFGTTTTQKLLQEGLKTADYTVTFKSSVPHMTRQTWGGQMTNFSSTGPVYDFTMKPQISAPGGMILSTWPLNGTGFAHASGTSMATPYLAGAAALLKSQFPKFTVAELTARLQSTSKPLVRPTRNDLSPPVQQGAGLVNVFDAIYAKSFVTPGQLELGPTEQLAEAQHTITIKNPTKNPVEYTLGHTTTPGVARYPYWDLPNKQGYLSSNFMRLASLPFAAKIGFPAGSTFTLGPGESREVKLDIEAPLETDHMIPFYGGYVTVKGSNREDFVIPYVGAAYNYTAAEVLGQDPVPSTYNTQDYPARGEPQLFYQSKGIRNHVQAKLSDLSLVASWLQAQVSVRFDLVRAETDFVPTYYGFDPEVPVNYTKTTAETTGIIAGVEVLGTNIIFDTAPPNPNLIDGFGGQPMWDAETYSRPVPMPAGGYRILVQMQKIGGDPEKREDWYTWMSGVIEIMEDIPL